MSDRRRLLGEVMETLGLLRRRLHDRLTEDAPFDGDGESVADLVKALGLTAERLIVLERQIFASEASKWDGDDDSERERDALRAELERRLARLATDGSVAPTAGEP